MVQLNEEKLMEIYGKIAENKALDLDGISNGALKLAAETGANLFASTFVACLKLVI